MKADYLILFVSIMFVEHLACTFWCMAHCRQTNYNRVIVDTELSSKYLQVFCQVYKLLALQPRAYGARFHLEPIALDPLHLLAASSKWPDGACRPFAAMYIEGAPSAR